MKLEQFPKQRVCCNEFLVSSLHQCSTLGTSFLGKNVPSLAVACLIISLSHTWLPRCGIPRAWRYWGDSIHLQILAPWRSPVHCYHFGSCPFFIFILLTYLILLARSSFVYFLLTPSPNCACIVHSAPMDSPCCPCFLSLYPLNRRIPQCLDL
jgi:hypothetical protein